MRGLVSAAFGYAVGGYHVVYDGIVDPWYIGLCAHAWFSGRCGTRLGR